MTVTVRQTPARPRLPAALWWLSAAWTLASVADNFMLFVLLWIAEPQGWSGVTTALVVLAVRLPTLLGGPLGGVGVDRAGAYRMMLVDGAVRVVLMAGLMVAGRTGDYPIAVVLVLGALAGTTAPFTFAAARVLAPRLVAPSLRGRANTLLSVGDQLPMLVGAALGGSSLAILGPAAVFAVPLVLLLGQVAITLHLSRRVRVAAPVADQSRPAAQPGGRRSLGRSPRVAGLIALSVAYYFAYGPFETVLPYFVRDQLHTDVAAYTILWIAFGAGALAGLPLAPLLSRRRPGVANALGAIAWGLCAIPFAAASSLPIATAIFVAAGVIWGPYTAIETTALQRWVSPGDHGRIFGTQRALLATATPVGAAVGVICVEWLSPSAILAASAAGCVLAGILALLNPSLRSPIDPAR